MEENNTNNPQPETAPILQDIAPPPKTNLEPTTPTSVIADAKITPEESSSKIDNLVATPPQDSSSMFSKDDTPSSSQSLDSNAPATQTVPETTPKNKHTKIIMLAIILFLLLSGAVIYLYINNNSDTTPTTSSKVTTQSTTPQSATVSSATTPQQDVDQATKVIDDTIKAVDSAQDLGANDLTDSSLGL